MNILTYNNRQYRIIHTINDNSLNCGCIMATERFASDIAGHLARRHNLENYYTFIPTQISHYGHKYYTEAICYKGWHIGYWDFPIPPEYSRFPGSKRNVKQDYKVLEQLLETLIGTLRLSRSDRDPFFRIYEDKINYLRNAQNWAALDKLFELNSVKTDLIKRVEKLTGPSIVIDALTFPKVNLTNFVTLIEEDDEDIVYPNRVVPPEEQIPYTGEPKVEEFTLDKLLFESTRTLRDSEKELNLPWRDIVTEYLIPYLRLKNHKERLNYVYGEDLVPNQDILKTTVEWLRSKTTTELKASDFKPLVEYLRNKAKSKSQEVFPSLTKMDVYKLFVQALPEWYKREYTLLRGEDFIPIIEHLKKQCEFISDDEADELSKQMEELSD